MIPSFNKPMASSALTFLKCICFSQENAENQPADGGKQATAPRTAPPLPERVAQQQDQTQGMGRLPSPPRVHHAEMEQIRSLIQNPETPIVTSVDNTSKVSDSHQLSLYVLCLQILISDSSPGLRPVGSSQLRSLVRGRRIPGSRRRSHCTC
jgi:hypothetical protein